MRKGGKRGGKGNGKGGGRMERGKGEGGKGKDTKNGVIPIKLLSLTKQRNSIPWCKLLYHFLSTITCSSPPCLYKILSIIP